METKFYIWEMREDSDRYSEPILMSEVNKEICQVCKAGYKKIVFPEKPVFMIKKRKKSDSMRPIENNNIISKKIQKILEENHFTGYHLKDIEITNGDLFAKEEYKEMIVDGRCGHMADIDGNILPYCKECGVMYPDNNHRTGTKIHDWDGSDIFRMQNFKTPIVTERVKNIMEEAKLANVVFIDVEEYYFW